jgi:hypothetical protein
VLHLFIAEGCGVGGNKGEEWGEFGRLCFHPLSP